MEIQKHTMRRSPCIALGIALMAAGLLGSCDDSSSPNPAGGGSGAPTTPGWNSSISYGTLTDTRDGHAYKTVKVGTQNWMAENLDYRVDSSWCYLNSADSCTKYGRLYQWAAAMGLDAGNNDLSWGGALPRQGICPGGWHVPSDAEWTMLSDFVGTSPGTKLKSSTGWSSSGNGTDTFGFNVLPGGDRDIAGKFRFVGAITYFWASSEFDADSSWRRGAYSTLESVLRTRDDKKAAHSLRCVEDGGTQAPSGSVMAPVFTPAGGTYSSAQTVALSSGTIGATIYFTTDGSSPTIASTPYASPVVVGASKTLKAIAVKTGSTASPVNSATYRIGGIASQTIPWNTEIKYGAVLDTRDGQVYKTVKIGTQTWMAENMNFKVDSSWCNSNSSDSCKKFGRIYQWASTMGLADSFNQSMWTGSLPHQGICPSGWHVPSSTEWRTLDNYLGSPQGWMLRSTAGWPNSDNGGDAYGFRALPAGARNEYNGFYWGYTNFWSSSDAFGSHGWYFAVLSDDVVVSDANKQLGFSVRCIEDDGSQPSTNTVVSPVFSPSGGAYPSTQSVAIRSTTDGARIYYTTDGSTPTTSSAEYTSPVLVNSSTTLMAIATKDGSTPSSLGLAMYTIGGSAPSSTIPWNTALKYGTLTDSRTGQVYRTATIGTQTWMAENLNLKVDSSWCYLNSIDSCSRYGRLYQWAAAMGLDSGYNSKLWNGTMPHQGICPTGWHVPSDAEWTTLMNYTGGQFPFTAGKNLKSRIGWDDAGNGIDTFGFCALPGGIRYLSGRSGQVGSDSYFWSSSESDSIHATDRSLAWNYQTQFSREDLKGYGLSVRCLKD